MTRQTIKLYDELGNPQGCGDPEHWLHAPKGTASKVFNGAGVPLVWVDTLATTRRSPSKRAPAPVVPKAAKAKQPTKPTTRKPTVDELEAKVALLERRAVEREDNPRRGERAEIRARMLGEAAPRAGLHAGTTKADAKKTLERHTKERRTESEQSKEIGRRMRGEQDLPKRTGLTSTMTKAEAKKLLERSR